MITIIILQLSTGIIYCEVYVVKVLALEHVLVWWDLILKILRDSESRTGCDRLMVLEWNRSERMVQLLDERDLGVLTAVMSLLVALVANSPEAYWNCVPKCVRTLERLTRSQDIPQEYTYYGIPSPWLQVCCSFEVVLDAISFWIH